MKFWTHEELHEIEEELLNRKQTIKHLPEKKLTKIEWKYNDWEKFLIKQCALFGYPLEKLADFLVRTKPDILHYIRAIGYENWSAYCESEQAYSDKNASRKNKVCYREIIEAAINRPLTKEEHIHHINCDHYDDSLRNLWLCERANHMYAHESYRKLQKELIAFGVVAFDRNTGDYYFNQDAIDAFVKQNPDD